MRKRKQRGTIIRIGDRWYVRYWERRNTDGHIVRKRVTHQLGQVTSRGKRPPGDVLDEAKRFMNTVNGCCIPPEHILTIVDFVEAVYLPWAKENKKPSTYHGYEDAWDLHLKNLVSRECGNLKDVRTYTIQQWLNAIGQKELSRNSLKRIKSVLSGIFKQAKRLGFYDGVNPVMDTEVNPHAAPPANTYAYSLEQIQIILARLPEPAATVFAVASFAGLRRGEIEGLEWQDYRNGELHVTRSIWNGKVTGPKTAMSCAPVPVIRPLAERLEMHRLLRGNPKSGPMFPNIDGRYANTNNLLNRAILPALNICRCGISEGKKHAKQDHKYERDTSIPEWRGFHAARRGLGSNLYRLGVPDKTIQQILRHSNVSVTLGYYVKTASPDVVAGMRKLEEELRAKDSDRTVKPDSGATPGLVN
jgi:integrase